MARVLEELGEQDARSLFHWLLEHTALEKAGWWLGAASFVLGSRQEDFRMQPFPWSRGDVGPGGSVQRVLSPTSGHGMLLSSPDSSRPTKGGH